MPLTRRSLLTGALAGAAVVGTGTVTSCSSSSGGSAASSPAGTAPPPPSVLPSASALQISAAELVPLQLFNWDMFTDEALFLMGGSSSLTAEPGEVLRIVQTINAQTGNPSEPTTETIDAYCQAFASYGDQLAQLAASSASHPVTARNRYLRASMYAAQELFFVLGSSQPNREEEVFTTCESRWNEAVALMKPAGVRFEVTSQFGSIPCYFFAPDESRDAKPTVIISSGSDGQNVEDMQFGTTAALQRGYNVILFEGPGQMTPLFVNNVVFTPDWDQVVGPIVEWAQARRDVGMIALVGISFGGMLCARAAAKVKGLSAVVLEPAAWNFAQLWKDQADVQSVRQDLQLPADQQAAAKQKFNTGFEQVWPNLPKSTQFTIYKRGSIMTRQTQTDARAGQPISDYFGLLEAMLAFDYEADYNAITIPTMLTSNEGDEFFAEQAAQAFDMLTNLPPDRKQLIEFTAAQGAQLHDQPNGPQVVQEYVFDWLDGYLR